MKLPAPLSSLDLLPGLLQLVVDGASGDHLRQRPAAGGFAIVEHVWHLADLEVEGYGVRIERLLREEDPELEDFDGEAVARERRYERLDALEGLRRFQGARTANCTRLSALSPPAWLRRGRQEGVGIVSLADLPRMMLGHDQSHARELADLLAGLAPHHPALPALRRLAGSAPLASG